MHHMAALQQRTKNHKYRDEYRRPPEGKQPAANCRADAVGRIVGTDVPADIGSGSE